MDIFKLPTLWYFLGYGDAVQLMNSVKQEDLTELVKKSLSRLTLKDSLF